MAWRNWTLIRIPVDLYQLHIFELVSYRLLPDSFSSTGLGLVGVESCLYMLFLGKCDRTRVSSERPIESNGSDSFPTDVLPHPVTNLELEEHTRPVSLAPAICM